MAKKDSTTTRKTVNRNEAVAPVAAGTNWQAIAVILALILACILGAAFVWFIMTMSNYAVVPVPAPTEVSPCDTACPAEKAPETAWLAFGRLDQNAKYFMGIAGIDSDLIREGTPLQQYHSMLTSRRYNSSLNLDPKLEDLNDGLKYVIVGDKVFKVPTTGKVAIDSVSWVRYVEDKDAVLICRDDTGSAGTWYGNCADTNPTWITDWVNLEKFLASGEFQPWAAQFTEVSESFDGELFNGKIEVFTTYW